MTQKNLQCLRSLLVFGVLLLPLSACNTIEGMGRDVTSAGEAMTGAAEHTKAK